MYVSRRVRIALKGGRVIVCFSVGPISFGEYHVVGKEREGFWLLVYLLFYCSLRSLRERVGKGVDEGPRPHDQFSMSMS